MQYLSQPPLPPPWLLLEEEEEESPLKEGIAVGERAPKESSAAYTAATFASPKDCEYMATWSMLPEK
jgi:hypothetical protein